MTLLRLLAALLALIALPVVARAQDAPPKPWEGVWRGTIGTFPVVACLQENGLGTRQGAYYYLSKKVPIRLTFDETTALWQEEAAQEHKAAPSWKLSPPSGDQLGGQWRQDGRELPVALTRVASDGDFGSCGSRAFMAARIGPIKVSRKPETAKGLTYEAIKYDVGPQFETVDIASFALIPQLPGDAAINRAVLLDPLKPEGEADFAGCLAGAISNLGMDGDFLLTRTPEAVSGDFLSVSESSGTYCGGAHPDAVETYRAFDRRTGQEINLWTWLTPRASTAEDRTSTGSREVAKALRTLAVRRMAPLEAECRDLVRDTEYWSVSLTSKGLGFTPSLPHVAAACEDTALIPWAVLKPWLSPQGKAAAARIIRGRK